MGPNLIAFGSTTTGLLFLLMLVCIVVFWVKLLRRDPKLDGMPGSPLEILVDLISHRFDLIPACMSYAHRNGGIALLRSGFTSGSDFVAISTAEYLQTFYLSRTNTTRSDQYLVLKEIAGEGLFTTSGHDWKKLRELAIATFYNSPRDKLMRPIYDEVEHLIAAFKEQANSKVFPAQAILKNAVMRSLSVNMIGETANPTVNSMMEPSEWYMKIFFQRMTVTLTDPANRYKPVFSLLPDGRKFYKRAAALNRDLLAFVQNARKKYDGYNEDGNVPEVWINRMFGRKTSDLTVGNELKVTYMAATDTSTMVLGFALTCMGLYPDIQEKVLEEDTAIQERLSGGTLTPDDLKDYKYLDRVIKETLRMFPAVPFLGRKLEEDTFFGKYLLPKGTNVIALQFASNYNENHFKEPYKFNPDRFLPENLHLIPPYAYNPFSAGPRNCLGTRYSNMVLKIFLSSIVRNFKVSSAYSGMKETLKNTVTEMTLKDRNHFPLKFELRQKQ